MSSVIFDGRHYEIAVLEATGGETSLYNTPLDPDEVVLLSDKIQSWKGRGDLKPPYTKAEISDFIRMLREYGSNGWSLFAF